LAFASVLLTTIVLFEVDGSERVREVAIPTTYRWSVWGLTLYSYVVVYLGAYVRHTDSDEACSGWPLCNGQVVPDVSATLVRNIFLHRLAALLLVAGIIWLVAWSYRLRAERPDLFRAGVIALVLVVLQATSGAIVVFTRVDLFAALAHAGLVGLLFGDLTY